MISVVVVVLVVVVAAVVVVISNGKFPKNKIFIHFYNQNFILLLLLTDFKSIIVDIKRID